MHHSDRGVQFLSIRYTERVAEAGGVSSVGSLGDSYDNALAESVIGLTMVFMLIESAQRRWRRIDGHELVALVRAGARFENGKLMEEDQDEKDAA